MHYFDENVMRLTAAPEYSAGFLKVSDSPGIGVELKEDVVKELILPGYQL
jgi:L-alanine-DL-glutamate epimerase-like enolase superfamily enzyme